MTPDPVLKVEKLRPGARLADLPVLEAEELSDTPRGERGHGSTGQ